VARIVDEATASQVKRPTRVKEKWIWYGNGKTPSATVLEHEVGPDPRFSRGGFYGPGLDPAERARAREFCLLSKLLVLDSVTSLHRSG
jgi:hypothetical protein